MYLLVQFWTYSRVLDEIQVPEIHIHFVGSKISRHSGLENVAYLLLVNIIRYCAQLLSPIFQRQYSACAIK
jgi:hypothetical protein